MLPLMKFGYTILYVNSVAETMAFYEQAFGLQQGIMVPTGDYGEMVTGDTKLAFANSEFVKTIMPVPFNEGSLDKAAPPIEIALVTEEVETAFERALNAGATLVKRPESKPWGQLVGYVRDNNGFVVEICSPIE